MTRRGRFITLEGGEGTGKSTLLAAISNTLEGRGIRLTVTREPGGTDAAEKIRDLVLSTEIGALSQAMLISAGRIDHLQKAILPALDDGQWVVCDRFVDSTRVYQGLGGASASDIAALERLAVGETGLPDRTLLLDAPVEALQARRSARGGDDVFERKPLAFHMDVRERFLEIARDETGRITVIDALQSPEAVLEDALAALQPYLETA